MVPVVLTALVKDMVDSLVQKHRRDIIDRFEAVQSAGLIHTDIANDVVDGQERLA